MKVIKDLIIVELASVLAGPLVGSFFSELGATVIKIENPNKGGDVTRSWKLTTENPENISAYYAAANYNKTIAFLDLKQSFDYDKLIEIIQQADIVINNIPLSSSKKLRIDFESIKQINTSIIYGQITGFGLDNPRAAFDLVLQAETGYLSMCGTPNGERTRMPVALIDVLSAHQMKEGLLLALLQKEANQSCFVHVSLYDTAVASLANQASNWLMANHVAQPMGTLHPNIAPYGEILTFEDRLELILAIGNDKQFNAFCSLINSDIDTNELFNTNPKRVLNRKILLQKLQEKADKLNGELIYNQCLKQNIPVGKINDLKTVFEAVEAQKLVQNSIIEKTSTKRVQTNVFEFGLPVK